MARLTFENLWVDGRWRSDVTVELDSTHRFAIAGDDRAVAARCYLDLLRGGYTGVAEFLYLHRVGPFADAANADQAIVAAARRVGISLTLLPALYQHSHFGREPAIVAQQPLVRRHQLIKALSSPNQNGDPC